MNNQSSIASEATNYREKQIDTKSALEILKDFYHEVKKEFKKNPKITAGIATSNEINSLNFVCNGFDLRLIIKEGGNA